MSNALPRIERPTRKQLERLAAFEFTPLLSKLEVDEQERAEENSWGPRRRMALVVLTKRKAELVNGFAGDQGYETAQDLIADLMEYRKHLGTLRDLAEAAVQRMHVAEACRAVASKGGAA